MGWYEGKWHDNRKHSISGVLSIKTQKEWRSKMEAEDEIMSCEHCAYYDGCTEAQNGGCGGIAYMPE